MQLSDLDAIVARQHQRLVREAFSPEQAELFRLLFRPIVTADGRPWRSVPCGGGTPIQEPIVYKPKPSED